MWLEVNLDLYCVIPTPLPQLSLHPRPFCPLSGSLKVDEQKAAFPSESEASSAGRFVIRGSLGLASLRLLLYCDARRVVTFVVETLY